MDGTMTLINDTIIVKDAKLFLLMGHMGPESQNFNVYCCNEKRR